MNQATLNFVLELTEAAPEIERQTGWSLIPRSTVVEEAKLTILCFGSFTLQRHFPADPQELETVIPEFTFDDEDEGQPYTIIVRIPYNLSQRPDEITDALEGTGWLHVNQHMSREFPGLSLADAVGDALKEYNRVSAALWALDQAIVDTAKKIEDGS